MLFVPNHVEVRKGEQIKFVLYNSGELDHEFVLATAQENQKHAEAMKMNPEMEHHDPNATRVSPKKTDEIVWRFTDSGEFEFACLIPGHRDAGMFGTVNVKYLNKVRSNVSDDKKVPRLMDVYGMSRRPSRALGIEGHEAHCSCSIWNCDLILAVNRRDPL